MKTASRAIGSIILCLTLAFAPATAKAAGESSANAGIAMLPGFFDTEAMVLFVEFERVMGSKLTVFGRFGMLDYSFDDGWYKEDGDGPGFDVGIRYYLTDAALKGLYIGGSAGIWTTDWTYTDVSWSGTPRVAGAGDTTALKVEFEVGYRIPIQNTPIAVSPTFRTGSFLGLEDSCRSLGGLSCSDSEIGIYGVLGATVGFPF